MRRCHSIDGIMNKCKLRVVLFFHYGNIMQNLNNFLFGSTKNIITEVVKDFRDIKIMMLSTHESHNEIEWDFEASKKWTCKFIWLIVVQFWANIIHRKLDDKEVEMCITKMGDSKISREEMGGDLNRLEPTKMENFKDRMAI